MLMRGIIGGELTIGQIGRCDKLIHLLSNDIFFNSSNGTFYRFLSSRWNVMSARLSVCA